MTSFVREILSSAGRLDSKEDLRSATERMEKNLGELKAGMRLQMEDHYAKFSSLGANASCPETSSHVARLKVAVDEVDALQSTLRVHLSPEVKQASLEMVELRKQLDQLRETVATANRIKDAYVWMEEANALLDEAKFFEAAEKLAQVGEMIPVAATGDVLSDLDEAAAFAAVREEHATAMETLLEEMSKRWDASVRLDEEKSTCGGVVVKLALGEVSGQLAQAMHRADMLSFRLGKFAHLLISLAFKPLVTDARCEVTEASTNEILIKRPNAMEIVNVPLPVGEGVFQKIEPLFGLIARVMDVPATPQGDKNLINLLGDFISEQITAILVEYCLSPAVPSCQDDLPQFESLLKTAQTFERNLKTAGFLKVSIYLISQSNFPQNKLNACSFLGKPG